MPIDKKTKSQELFALAGEIRQAGTENPALVPLAKELEALVAANREEIDELGTRAASGEEHRTAQIDAIGEVISVAGDMRKAGLSADADEALALARDMINTVLGTSEPKPEETPQREAAGIYEEMMRRGLTDEALEFRTNCDRIGLALDDGSATAAGSDCAPGDKEAQDDDTDEKEQERDSAFIAQAEVMAAELRAAGHPEAAADIEKEIAAIKGA